MTTTTDPLGILAGGGRIPLEIARIATARGQPVHVVGLGGEVGQDLSAFPHTVVPWGAIGALLRAFRANRCRDIVIAGRVRRPNLWQVKPDLGLVTALPQIVRLLEGGDDSVLRRVVRFFESQGFRVLGIPDVAPELLIGTGVLGAVEPTAADRAAIAEGFALIAALAELDVGQAVVMAGSQALAIEGAEGTDRMLARVSAEGRRAVLVKRPKPGQELRVDMPAVGSGTVEAAVRAGLSGIGLEAGRVIAADGADMVQAADAADLFIWGDQPDARSAGRLSGVDVSRFAPIGTRRASHRDLRDAALGCEAVVTLGRWVTSTGAVAVRGYVVAVGAREPAGDLLRRAGQLRAWGLRGRRGVAVIAGPPLAEHVLAAADAGLAGLAFLSAPDGPMGAVADQAAVSRVFVLSPPVSDGAISNASE